LNRKTIGKPLENGGLKTFLWWFNGIEWDLPSGKHTRNYGKSPFFNGENSLFLWQFSVVMLVYQRVMADIINK